MLPENYQELLQRNKPLVFIFLAGLVLTLLGGLLIKKGIDIAPAKVEVLNETTPTQEEQKIVVEIGGEVQKPGVYKLPAGARVEDGLIVAGGLSENADRDFLEKNLNRAARLSDGQKIFIPAFGQQSNVLSANNTSPHQTVSTNLIGQGSGLININSATAKELDSLSGIGPVYAQNIIEHRPYSNIDELLLKKVLPKSTFEKIKNSVTTF